MVSHLVFIVFFTLRRLSYHAYLETLTVYYITKLNMHRQGYYHRLYGRHIVKRHRSPNSSVNKSEPTWPEFVQYLLATPTDQYDEHWKPMHQLCSPCILKFTVIVKMETFKQVWINLTTDTWRCIPKQLLIQFWYVEIEWNLRIFSDISLTTQFPEFFTFVTERKSTIQYCYRKCRSHAIVLSPTLPRGNCIYMKEDKLT